MGKNVCFKFESFIFLRKLQWGPIFLPNKSPNEMTAKIQRKMLDYLDQKTRKCPDAKDNVKWWHSMEKMRCESESLEKCIPTTIMLED